MFVGQRKEICSPFKIYYLKKIIDIGYLTTHEFDFDNAKDAFDLVVSKNEPYIGIALKYDIQKKQINLKF